MNTFPDDANSCVDAVSARSEASNKLATLARHFAGCYATALITGGLSRSPIDYLCYTSVTLQKS